MTEYAYAPGEWTALAYQGRAALLAPTVDAEVIDEVWRLLTEGAQLETWLELLASNGLAALPDFGLVAPGDDGLRVVVRGAVTVDIEDYQVSAGDMRTWREHVVPTATGLLLRAGGGEPRFPLVAGVVLASTLRVGQLPEVFPTQDDQTEVSLASQEPGWQEPVAAVPMAADSMAAQAEWSDHAPVQPPAQSAVAPIEEQAESPIEEPADATVEAAPPEDMGAVADPAAEAESPESTAGSEPESHAEVHAMPDRRTALDESQAEPADDTEAQIHEWPTELSPPATPPAREWGPPAGAHAAEPTERLPELPKPNLDSGDHDGHTLLAAEIPAIKDRAWQTPPVPAADNSALQLALSTGQHVGLDQAVLIGRAPESSRFGFGQTPKLITVPSPQQDISRTHVEIKQEGDHVLVTDLRSTNGTVVVVPGTPPRRLHPGESVPVPVGTVVDLGDGITAVIATPETSTVSA
ncbi:MAG: FHA domain-containing protein [Beutenbergiaceae bacterium]